MQPTYYEGIVLVTIKRLNEKGLSCSLDNLVSHACMGNKTIAKAIERLAAKGRLEIVKPAHSNKPWEYVVKDPPTEQEYHLTAYHLVDKVEPPNGKHPQ